MESQAEAQGLDEISYEEYIIWIIEMQKTFKELFRSW